MMYLKYLNNSSTWVAAFLVFALMAHSMHTNVPSNFDINHRKDQRDVPSVQATKRQLEGNIGQDEELQDLLKKLHKEDKTMLAPSKPNAYPSYSKQLFSDNEQGEQRVFDFLVQQKALCNIKIHQCECHASKGVIKFRYVLYASLVALPVSYFLAIWTRGSDCNNYFQTDGAVPYRYEFGESYKKGLREGQLINAFCAITFGLFFEVARDVIENEEYYNSKELWRNYARDIEEKVALDSQSAAMICQFQEKSKELSDEYIRPYPMLIKKYGIPRGYYAVKA